MTTNLPVPARALAIAAHPDDIEFGCGGTFAKWARAGCEIYHIICTDGSKGTSDPDRDPAQLVATRATEQRAAARTLGGTADVVFLGWPDGELESGTAQRREIARWIRTIAPMSPLATTRGSTTGSTPITVTPAFSSPTVSSRRAIPCSSPISICRPTGREPSCFSKPTRPTTSRTCPRRLT